MGGGALFFRLQPDQAFLSDLNEELVTTYLQVRDHPERLIDQLRKLPVDKGTYAAIRGSVPTSDTATAVRFLYLNRTSFGGIYRLNRSGRFNVPFGGGQRTTEALWKDDLLIRASAALQKARVSAVDFEIALASAGAGDLVYCDPTYTVKHDSNGFRRYNERLFSWADQIRLATASRVAAGRGAIVVVSNAFHHDVAQLYQGSEVLVVERPSTLCPDPARRTKTTEYVFILAPAGGSGALSS